MQVTLTGYAVAQIPPDPLSWWSLFSNEYDSDGQARQRSVDWAVKNANGDYLYKDYGYPGGLPDQYYLYQDPWVQLTEKRARWLFDVQCLSWRGKRAANLSAADLKLAKSWWKDWLGDGLCYTNKTGTGSRHDYINNTRVDQPDMSYQVLLLGGNRVDVLGEVVNMPEKYFGVQKAYPHRLIRAVDIDNLPAPEAFLKDPYVCHLCTTIKPNGEHGLFPQFDECARGVIWAKGGRVYVWDHLIGLK